MPSSPLPWLAVTGVPSARWMGRFGSASSSCRGPAADPAVQAARAQLRTLHGKALEACAEECERLRLLLVNHLEYAEGRAAYQRIDMFAAGDGR